MVSGRTASDYSIAVAYDGEKTEDDYFRGWSLVIPPSRLTLVPILVNSGGSPLRAVERSARAFRGMKDVAEFWCVTDQDDADDACVEQAFQKAASSNIRLCLSTRCFEIWIALHFRKVDRAVSSESEAIKLVQQDVPSYGVKRKIAPFVQLLPLTDQAVRNGEWLQSQQLNNPRTNVHPLVRKLRDNLK